MAGVQLSGFLPLPWKCMNTVPANSRAHVLKRHLFWLFPYSPRTVLGCSITFLVIALVSPYVGLLQFNICLFLLQVNSFQICDLFSRLLSCCSFNLLLRRLSLEIGMGMGVVLALILQLVQLCIIGFAVTVQGSKGRNLMFRTLC